MSIKGSLETFYLSSLLQLLCNDRKTGTLRLRDGDHCITVTLKDGSIVNATSTMLQELLGYLLRSEGVITSDELESYLRLARAQKKKLGTILIENNKIKPESLQYYLRLHVEHILYSLFLWKQGTFEYNDVPSDQMEQSDVELDTMEVILEASRRVDEMSVLTRQVPDPSQVLSIPEHATTCNPALLTPQEKAIYTLIDGNLTIQEIIQKSGYDTFTVYKALYSLISSGFVQPQEQNPPTLTLRFENGDAPPRASQTTAAPAPQRAKVSRHHQEGDNTAPALEGPPRIQPLKRRGRNALFLGIGITVVVGAAAVFFSLTLTDQKQPHQASQGMTTSPLQQREPKPVAPQHKKQPQPEQSSEAPQQMQEPVPQTHVGETQPYQDPNFFFFVDLPAGYNIQEKSEKGKSEVLITYPPNNTLTICALRSSKPWDSEAEMYAAIATLQNPRTGLNEAHIESYGQCELSGVRGYRIVASGMQDKAFCKLLQYGLYV